jgi:rhodanese-related sulfurtransferase
MKRPSGAKDVGSGGKEKEERNPRAAFLVFLLATAVWPRESHAIPPPEILSNIGSSFVQIFSLLAVFLSLAFSFVLQYFKRIGMFVRRKPIIILLVAISTLGVALSTAYTVVEVRRLYAQEEYGKQVAEKLHEEIARKDAEEAEDTRSDFFKAHENLPLLVTNSDFEQQAEDAFILDAREDEEYEIGHYPGSTHIRFADLLAGKWEVLPRDRLVFVICWSGIRGSEISAYLRERGIMAQALENGVSGWVEAGGIFEGEIAFSAVYSDPQYTKIFSTDEIKELQQQNVLTVDTRQESASKPHPILGSVAISAIYTPTEELESELSRVPSSARIVTICEDFVTCFDAKIIGIKLEKRGNIFLGRYATPWEY